jgi:hypothetical protein
MKIFSRLFVSVLALLFCSTLVFADDGGSSSSVAIGWTPTDLFVPAFYEHFISLQGEFSIAPSSALTIPVGYASYMGFTMLMIGIGYRFYPTATSVEGFYLGLRAGILNVSSSP